MVQTKEKLDHPESIVDISTLPEKLQKIHNESYSMFSLFPQYNGTLYLIEDIPGQVKVVTLSLVKMYILDSEYRVAHLILSNLCNKYPEDPYLWNYLGKLYLIIGKREKAIEAFNKSDENFASISEKTLSIQKIFHAYLPYILIEE